MSITSLDETPIAAAPEAAPAPAAPEKAGAATFRGRTLEELLPQIRDQLGPDAIVLRQRDGLVGGIGGFFQQRFVEIEATAGRPRVDVYDEEPAATPESFARLLADAEAHADPIVTATATTSVPSAAAASTPAAAASAPPPAAASVPAATDALAAELREAGMSASFAARLLADAEAHELPFAHGDLRAATRRALARRIPTAMPYRAGGIAVAFAGPGSTSCADALATAYARAGRRAHAVATIEHARTRIERDAPDALVALDLPPIATDRNDVAALAERLSAVELDERVMVVPAELDLPSARALHDRLAPLAPTALALACQQPSAPLGAALELACTTRLPVAYVLDHVPAGAIAPADPTALAERLLP